MKNALQRARYRLTTLTTLSVGLLENFAGTLAGSIRVGVLLEKANTLYQRLIDLHERRC